ncbi:RNA polymerase sigma-70 factor (ECF subfamily) [Crossiella equi]|uniref:RNA polymerase sigma-70 factor (ECF subfamily) n=1 Tax=Crossiella equi TaxID=130796 RepID=A0ABS5ACJ7_9PSEU|nr:sigma-70 family RNA polymerase sigma factor [Crossiella equi]MBP2473425.1 RNA polymerase sigma-70 factor (ECF subfamily) [Crossiella equi]
MTRADTDLLGAAARGDDAAFDELVRRHTTRMYRVALRIVGDQAEAEDVVQEAWVSAWRGLSRFRGESAPATWLYRVVTNAALAHLRRRKPTVPLGEAAETVLGMTDRAADPEYSAIRNEQAEHVLRAIATLEPSQRVPLVLRELEEMSYEEVAEVLDVPVPTLRSRLYRARVALLAKLEELR